MSVANGFVNGRQLVFKGFDVRRRLSVTAGDRCGCVASCAWRLRSLRSSFSRSIWRRSMLSSSAALPAAALGPVGPFRRQTGRADTRPAGQSWCGDLAPDPTNAHPGDSPRSPAICGDRPRQPRSLHSRRSARSATECWSHPPPVPVGRCAPQSRCKPVPHWPLPMVTKRTFPDRSGGKGGFGDVDTNDQFVHGSLFLGKMPLLQLSYYHDHRPPPERPFTT